MVGACIEPGTWEQGWKKYMARDIKKHVNVPLIAVANIKEPYIAEEILQEGCCDLVGISRGVGYGQPYPEVTKREDWSTVFDVNVFGVVNCVHHMLPHLVEQRGGHIVITSSVAGLGPLPYQTICVASKHAVYGFAQSLRYELKDKNIKVSVVCPGAVATNIFYRALDYSLHFELPVPPNAISGDQAGAEILEGIRTGQDVIPVNDDARGLYQAIRTGDYDHVEAFMQAVTAQNESALQQATKTPNGSVWAAGR